MQWRLAWRARWRTRGPWGDTHGLELLPPARVDPGLGHRRQAPSQLEQARLVASLCQPDIPFAQVKVNLALAAGAAAGQIAAAGTWPAT